MDDCRGVIPKKGADLVRIGNIAHHIAKFRVLVITLDHIKGCQGSNWLGCFRRQRKALSLKQARNTLLAQKTGPAGHNHMHRKDSFMKEKRGIAIAIRPAIDRQQQVIECLTFE